ncbi:MAG: carbohydrate ABC transporter permease [Candidatus Infernicultor aquiphilus]|nr:MAG: carbohydrate ABC transporter permease [Candidatus Atribacteria bacterium CG08_land_8_20_14_0_20_33_29]
MNIPQNPRIKSIFVRSKRVLSSPMLIRYLLLLLGLTVMVTPMIYMITSSFRPNSLTFAYPPKIIPAISELTVENYLYILFKQNFFRYMLNTLYVAVAITTLSAIISSMMAYCISRFKFPGRNILYGMIITIMLIPGLAMLVPQFELAVKFKLIDNLWGIILFYTAWVVPFSTFLIKGFIDNIPKELDESMYIDGGTVFTIYQKVIIPMASPAIAAVSIFNFLFAFEELGWAQTILRTDQVRTLSVAITQFFQAHNRTDWGYVFAITNLSMIPVIILYLLLQRYFISGLSSGAIKG